MSPPHAHAAGRLPWRLVAPLSATQIVSWGSLIYAFTLFVEPMSREFGWSKAALSAAYSLGLVASGLGAVPVGHLIERGYGRFVLTGGVARRRAPAGALVAGQRLSGLHRRLDRDRLRHERDAVRAGLRGPDPNPWAAGAAGRHRDDARRRLRQHRVPAADARADRRLRLARRAFGAGGPQRRLRAGPFHCRASGAGPLANKPAGRSPIGPTAPAASCASRRSGGSSRSSCCTAPC